MEVRTITAISGPPTYGSLAAAIQELDTAQLTFVIGYVGREAVAMALGEAQRIFASSAKLSPPAGTDAA